LFLKKRGLGKFFFSNKGTLGQGLKLNKSPPQKAQELRKGLGEPPR